MKKRSPRQKPLEDFDKLAAQILAQAIGGPSELASTGKKNPAGVALSRARALKRGKSGGKSRGKSAAKAKARPKAKAPAGRARVAKKKAAPARRKTPASRKA